MKAYKHDKAIKWLEKHYVQAKSNLFILSFVQQWAFVFSIFQEATFI